MRPIGFTATIATICGALTELCSGRVANTGTLTLTPSVTSTVITRQGVAVGDCIHLSPQTLNAAAALTTTIAIATKNTITLTHTSTVTADRTFLYSFWAIET